MAEEKPNQKKSVSDVAKSLEQFTPDMSAAQMGFKPTKFISSPTQNAASVIKSQIASNTRSKRVNQSIEKNTLKAVMAIKKLLDTNLKKISVQNKDLAKNIKVSTKQIVKSIIGQDKFFKADKVSQKDLKKTISSMVRSQEKFYKRKIESDKELKKLITSGIKFNIKSSTKMIDLLKTISKNGNKSLHIKLPKIHTRPAYIPRPRPQFIPRPPRIIVPKPARPLPPPRSTQSKIRQGLAGSHIANSILTSAGQNQTAFILTQLYKVLHTGVMISESMVDRLDSILIATKKTGKSILGGIKKGFLSWFSSAKNAGKNGPSGIEAILAGLTKAGTWVLDGAKILLPLLTTLGSSIVKLGVSLASSIIPAIKTFSAALIDFVELSVIPALPGIATLALVIGGMVAIGVGAKIAYDRIIEIQKLLDETGAILAKDAKNLAKAYQDIENNQNLSAEKKKTEHDKQKIMEMNLQADNLRKELIWDDMWDEEASVRKHKQLDNLIQEANRLSEQINLRQKTQKQTIQNQNQEAEGTLPYNTNILPSVKPDVKKQAIDLMPAFNVSSSGKRGGGSFVNAPSTSMAVQQSPTITVAPGFFRNQDGDLARYGMRNA